MNSRQQGFQEIQIDHYSYLNAQNVQQPSNFRRTLSSNKHPLTMFNNIQIYQSPDQKLYLTPQPNNQIQYIQFSQMCSRIIQKPSSQQQQKTLQPLQSIIFKKQKNQQESIIDNERTTYQMISDIFPKRYVCCYNKFQQNIFLKHDLTIIVKNIYKLIRLELLKSIQPKIDHTKRNINQLVDNFRYNNNQKQRSVSASIYRKNTQSQNSFIGTQQTKIYIKKQQQKSPLQLQKSLILNTTNRIKNNQIQFFSNFQSGNLHLVFKDNKIDNNLYYLFLTNDTNTHGFNQWFYFGIKFLSTQKKKYRFVIMNISKQFKYHSSMKLLQYKNQKWRRQKPFTVYKNKFIKYNSGNLISLDFQYQNQGKKDQMTYFSLSYPYTYTRILNLLKQIKKKTYKNLFVSIQSLGKTQLTNQIPVIRIEKARVKQNKDNTNNYNIKRSYIVILARQHASQTPASFICQYLIKTLLSPNNPYQNLFNRYNFVILPMTNPDGVIHGNSRTNIKGYDMNRLWQVYKQNPPSVQTDVINNFIISLLKNSNIEYVIDLHSHSKQYGSFLYCCQQSTNKKLFNYFFTLDRPQCSYEKCKVNLTSDKKCTFRGQMYYRLGIRNSYTIQTSYYGYRQKNSSTSNEQGGGSITPFIMNSYQNIANGILFGINQIWKLENLRNRNERLKQLEKIIRQIDQRLRLKQRLNQLKTARQNNSQSDSDPQNQYLQVRQRQQNGQLIEGVNKRKNSIQQSFQTKQLSRSIQRSLLQKKSRKFMTQNRSLQMISKIQCQYENISQQKKSKRKRIYSTKQNKLMKTSVDFKSFNQQYDNMSKKYPSNVQKQIDFRKTLRRGLRMAKSQTGFTQNQVQLTKKTDNQIQQKSYFVYPTSSNISINYDNIRLLHQTLFKGTIKVKALKQQSRQFKRAQKVHKQQKIASYYQFSVERRLNQSYQKKNILKNKMIQSSIQQSGLNKYLNIGKIQTIQNKSN